MIGRGESVQGFRYEVVSTLGAVAKPAESAKPGDSTHSQKADCSSPPKNGGGQAARRQRTVIDSYRFFFH
jgi:hypothetical protein